jgi:hypothetical protein
MNATKTQTEPRKVSSTLYMVDSKTHTLVTYEVRLMDHGWECNCEAAAHHRTCWHLVAVLNTEYPTLKAHTVTPEEKARLLIALFPE